MGLRRTPGAVMIFQPIKFGIRGACRAGALLPPPHLAM